jgi:hypothetical protein
MCRRGRSLFYYYEDKAVVPSQLTPSFGSTRGGFTVEVHLGSKCVTRPAAPADAVAVSVREWSDLSVAGGTRGVESSRASPPHMPREDGRVHTADSSITNLADALSLLSMWRLSKP